MRLFGILLLFYLLNTSNLIFAQSLTKDDIKKFAQKMTFKAEHKIEVLSVSDVHENVQVALIQPPYREFPSILVFKYDKDADMWNRSFETLGPGIQDKSSGLLDFHTTGFGMDFIIGDNLNYHFNDEQVQVTIKSAIERNAILIPYQNFLHMQMSDNSQPNFETYTIDKTNYYDFAVKLFGSLYEKYPKEECLMFDTPNLLNLKFDYNNGTYIIIATTKNHQIWTYSFKGVNETSGLLEDKKIIVEKAR